MDLGPILSHVLELVLCIWVDLATFDGFDDLISLILFHQGDSVAYIKEKYPFVHSHDFDQVE